MLDFSDKRFRKTAWPTSAFLLVVVVFLYFFLFELPATPFFGDADQSIFLYEAERMFNGEVMYRDFFEFTLPGTQVFYALLFGVFGVKFWIVSVTTLLLGLATASLMLAISKRILPSPLYFLPATVFIFFGFRWAGLDGSHRMFSPVFILTAIWLLMRGKEPWNLILAGCSLAIASFFTQQRGFVVLAAFMFFLLADNLFTREKRNHLVKSWAAICLSFAVSLTALCLYFVVVAGPEKIFYATIAYPFSYYGYGHPNHFSVYFIELQKAFAISKPSDILALMPVILYCMLLPFVHLIFMAILVKNRKTLDWSVWCSPVLIALTSFFLTFTTTAPNIFRLFQVSGPALIVLVWTFYRFGPALETGRRIAYGFIAVLMTLGAFQAVRIQTNWDLVHLDLPVGRVAMVASKQADRYQWLRSNTSPGDYFFEVYEPFVYFPLSLKNPTKVGQFWPSEYTRPDQVAEAVYDLGEKRPRYMLWDNGYLHSAGPRISGDNTGPLADFVEDNYAPINEVYKIGGRSIQIWEIKAK